MSLESWLLVAVGAAASVYLLMALCRPDEF
ncbi:potassium-transporting ATPase subunit F [Pokkaliibacter sp. CJK22405]